jgi:Competence protein CoiA-like family
VIFNHARQRVEHFSGGESLCPLCGTELIARRGEIVIWHWAHRAFAAGRTACAFEESPWHLAWKDTYAAWPNWTVEQLVMVRGRKFILDAANLRTGRVREFVHSLSPYYREKHRVLLEQYDDVRWLFDGCVFLSKRCERCRDGRGVRNVLKPRALLAAEELAPRVGVHLGRQIFRCWRENVWYPIGSETARRLTAGFITKLAPNTELPAARAPQ